VSRSPERSEGEAKGSGLRLMRGGVTSDGRPPESGGLENLLQFTPMGSPLPYYELRVPNSLLWYDHSDPQYSVEPAMDFA